MEDKMIAVGMYADQTGMFNESELNDDNGVVFLMPEWLVRKWFDENNLKVEDSEDGEEITFEQWLNEIYTYDSTDGLYWFALENGVRPSFGIDGAHYVFWRDNNNFKTMVFEGSYDECRWFMRENEATWKSEDGKEYELEVE